MPSFTDQLFNVIKRTVAGEVGRAIGKRIGDFAGELLSSSDSPPVHGSSHREAVDDIYQKMQARIEAQEKKAAESTKASDMKPKRKPAVTKDIKPKR